MKFSEPEINSLIDEVAAAADVTPEQAASVLKVLHVERLVDIVNATNELYANDGARRALGVKPGAPLEELNLHNVRLGTKGSDSFVDVVA